MSNYDILTVIELRGELKKRGERVHGNKSQLIHRLIENDQKNMDTKLIKITICTLMGQFAEYNLSVTTTVYELKNMISQIRRIAPNKLILRYKIYDQPKMGDLIFSDGMVSRELQDNHSLKDYGITNDTMLDMQIRIF